MNVRTGITLIAGSVIAAYGAAIAVSWYAGDSVTRRSIETSWLLRSHLVVQQPERARSWLLANHGEAASSEVMNVFVAWSISHPEQAELLVAGFDVKEVPDIAARVGWSALDSGQDAPFESAFVRSTSNFFALALEELWRSREYLPR